MLAARTSAGRRSPARALLTVLALAALASCAHLRRPAAPVPPPPSPSEQAPAVPTPPPAPAPAPELAPEPAPAAPAPPAALPPPPPPALPGPPAPATAPGPTTPPALDLASLQRRLRASPALGTVTKLSIKSDVDDLLEQLRAYYAGESPLTLAELRQRYELLLSKVVALLQNGDPELARAVSSSREAIWAILSDRRKFRALPPA